MDEKKCKKRPEKQIYRPGMGKLLGRKSESNAESKTDEENKVEERTDTDNRNQNDCISSNKPKKESSLKGKSSFSKENRSFKESKLPPLPPLHFKRSRNPRQINQKYENNQTRNDGIVNKGNENENTSEQKQSDHETSRSDIQKGKTGQQRGRDSYHATRHSYQEQRRNLGREVQSINNQRELQETKIERKEELFEKSKQDVLPRNNSVSTNEKPHNKEKSVKPKTQKSPRHSTHKNKTNKPDMRQENIPPRFRKKMQEMQKSHSQGIHRVPENTANEINQNTQEALLPQEHIHHRGLIRLPIHPFVNVNSPQCSMTPNKFYANFNHGPINDEAFCFNYMQGREFMIPRNVAPGKQLFDPYQPRKPCVAIRPTQHVPVLPHSSRDEHHSNLHTDSPSSSPDTNLSQWPASQPYLNFHDNSLPTSPPSFPNFPNYNLVTSQVFNILSHTGELVSKKRYKPVIEKNMHEAILLEKELQKLLAERKLESSSIDQLRFKIQLRYEYIILSHPRFCADNNVEQMLWKAAFYQFIEFYRREMEENSLVLEEAKTALLKVVDEASLFFENLMVKLQETYDFNIDKFIEHEYDPQYIKYDVMKLVAISAQKIYLYLGDLARYKEQACRTSNFGKARNYYLKAQQLVPKNGRPYNQLALLAMFGKRKLDAVYYYMRSLAVSNPFLSARENLLCIFDEVCKKYEANERKRIQERLSAFKRLQSPSSGNNFNIPDERRLRLDGTSFELSNFLLERGDLEEELDTLTSVDLNKRFVLSFLHVHGKLFSKSGMESFLPCVNQMLLEFRCLLKRSPTPISSQRLLQLVSINMFSVFNTCLKMSSENYGPNCRSLLQEQAIQVTFAMVTLLLECSIKSLKEHFKSKNPNLVSDDVTETLPAIKVWTDWMSCQKQLWSPPPPASEFKTGCKEDLWTTFADFLTIISEVNVRSVKLLPTKLEGCEAIFLPEDTFIYGFLPLMSAPHSPSYAQTPYDKEKARTCFRITRIQFFGDYLCGISNPYLEFDVENKHFVSLITTRSNEENYEVLLQQNVAVDYSDNEPEDTPTDSSSIENFYSLNDENGRTDWKLKDCGIKNRP